MLGAYAALTHLIRKETLIDVVRRMISIKTESNLEALQMAYDRVQIYESLS